MRKSIDTHRPPHLYLDDTYYFITISTLYKKPYFNTDQKKQFILQSLHTACRTYQYGLIAWVILDNHSHVLLKVNNSGALPQFIRSIQGKSAIELNKLSGTPGVQRWYQYWDKCIEDEKGFWTRFNYIHQNPVKHGYVHEMKDHQFSSFGQYTVQYGKEWLRSCFEQYPIVSFITTDEF